MSHPPCHGCSLVAAYRAHVAAKAEVFELDYLGRRPGEASRAGVTDLCRGAMLHTATIFAHFAAKNGTSAAAGRCIVLPPCQRLLTPRSEIVATLVPS